MSGCGLNVVYEAAIDSVERSKYGCYTIHHFSCTRNCDVCIADGGRQRALLTEGTVLQYAERALRRGLWVPNEARWQFDIYALRPPTCRSQSIFLVRRIVKDNFGRCCKRMPGRRCEWPPQGFTD